MRNIHRIVRLCVALAALATPAPLLAQCADTLVHRITAHVDSGQAETLRRSATTGRYLAPRATVVRHHLAQILTLVNRCGVLTPTVTVTFGTTTITRWASGAIGRYETGDSVVICAVVQVGDVHRLGTPYVIAHAVHNDSIVWRTVTPPATGDLRERCRRTWDPSTYGSLATAIPYPVTWEALRVEGFTLALPFAKPGAVP